MTLIALDHWPLWVAMLLLIISCFINLRDRKMLVPNWLSSFSILSGLLCSAALVNAGIVPSAGGGFLASLSAAFVSAIALLPLYLLSALSAGSVKMQASFGAWVGCALPPGQAMFLSAVAVLISVGIIFAFAMLDERVRKKPDPAPAARPQRKLVPAQPFLAVGSIVSTLAMSLLRWL